MDEVTKEIWLMRCQVNMMAGPYATGPNSPFGSLDLIGTSQASDTAVAVHMGKITTSLEGGSIKRCVTIFSCLERVDTIVQQFLGWTLNDLHEGLNKAENKPYRKVCGQCELRALC